MYSTPFPSLSGISFCVSGVDTYMEELLVPVCQHVQPVPPPFSFSATTLLSRTGSPALF